MGEKRTRYDKQQIKSHSMDTRYKAIAIREHCFPRYEASPETTNLQVKVASALLKKGIDDLGKQFVGVESVTISEAGFSYLNDTTSNAPVQPETAEADTATSLPWTIDVQSLQLKNSSGTYGLMHHIPQQGLDPDYIQLSGLNLGVNSFYNKGSEIKLKLQQLAFTKPTDYRSYERQGNFDMNSEQISLSGFSLKAFFSQNNADIKSAEEMWIRTKKRKSRFRIAFFTSRHAEYLCLVSQFLQKEIALLAI
ncbi:MAG: hypothetical protein V8R52_10070 [Coprobacter fastidiosus]